MSFALLESVSSKRQKLNSGERNPAGSRSSEVPVVGDALLNSRRRVSHSIALSFNGGDVDMCVVALCVSLWRV